MVKKSQSFTKNLLLGISFLVIVVMIITGCAPDAYDVELPKEPELNEEGQTQPEIVLHVLITFISESSKELFTNQVNTFEKENPGINVNLDFLLEEELLKLTPESEVDIAGINYNAVAQFQLRGLLQPLDGNQFLLGKFLVEGIISNTFGSSTYAVPWLRYNCSPNYLNLALLKSSPDINRDAALLLMQFLTNIEQQNQNLAQGWYPTTKSFYDEKVVECTDQVTFRLSPENVPVNIEKTQGDISKLNESLGAQVIIDSAASSGFYAKDRNLTRLAVAIDNNQEYSEFKVFGTLSIEDPEWADLLEVPAGRYLVVWQPELNENGCFLIDENREKHPVTPELFESISEMDKPTVAVIQGSVGGCFWIFKLKMCIGIGSEEQPVE